MRKVSFFISRLMGKARVWGVALVTNSSLLVNNYVGFVRELRTVFNHPHQELRSAADYTMEFWTLAEGIHWNEPVQIDAFLNGLQAELQAELACKQDGNMLNEGVHLAITDDCLLLERRQSTMVTGSQATGAVGGKPSCRQRCFLNKAVPLEPHQSRAASAPSEQGLRYNPQGRSSTPRGRIYPLSQEEEWAIEQYITEALQQGCICPSTSPASARVFFVKKRDRDLRPCLDYRGLNKLLVQYPYLLPLFSAALEQLRGARYFTKLDLSSAYNLIQVKEGDEWKTAFSTAKGHYEYLVLPYGLATAPSIFQAYINEVLREFLGRSIVTYIDDILNYSPSWNQLVRKVRPCSSPYYETICTAKQKNANSTSKVQRRIIVISAIYKRFIKAFSSLAKPFMDQLWGPARRIKWTTEIEKAFKELKTTFSTAPVLQQPNPERTFVVEVDASDIGVGAALSQHTGERGGLQPIAYFSWKLSPAEWSYGVGDRELLAMKLAFEEWRHWLEGARHTFTVYTHHKNLEYLQTT
ncbi:hypothetical protein P4O66_017542 [Electrophorus voltai]|uniref:ribonuclease H n=1 Tax=Electrophorus voltai TaxID=2609070 RepID=A0AAD8YUE0_9TELE|nr:hypothetical protein P4O66_017542 [Electrophorus voltai]